MECECYEFSLLLLDICKDIYENADERVQWIIFKSYLRKYMLFVSKLLNKLRQPYSFCPLKTSSILIEKIPEFRVHYASLPYLLVEFITSMYFEPCIKLDFQNMASLTKDFQNLRSLPAFHQSDSHYMKLMLNLGILMELPAVSPDLLHELKHEIHTFFESEGFESIDGFLDNDTYDEDLDSLTEEAIQSLQSSFFGDVDHKNYKRTYLSMIAITAVQQNIYKHEDSVTEERISCLRMYFAATQDAFLSVSETRHALYACLKLLNKLQLFDTYCEEFNKLMPECSAKLETRTLSHFARFQIREILRGSHLSLPSAVHKTDLPKILKKFLLGEVDHVSRKRGKDKKLTLRRLMSRLQREQGTAQDVFTQNIPRPVLSESSINAALLEPSVAPVAEACCSVNSPMMIESDSDEDFEPSPKRLRK